MERRKHRAQPASFADVTVEMTHMSLRGQLPVVLLGAIGLVLSSIVVAHRYRDNVEWTLAAVIFLLAVTRITLIAKLSRSDTFRERFVHSRNWRLFADALQTLYLSFLAVSTTWNFYQRRTDVEVLCSLGTFILCLGISSRISSNPVAAKVQGLIMLAVLAACLFNPHDEIAITSDLLIGMFAVAHCQAVQQKFDVVVEQIRSRQKLLLLSERDALTGLRNRRAFGFELDALCRCGATFAILFIDLDHFKPVNDQYGHEAGDNLLRAVAERLTSLVRAQDVVARLGGDEFALLQFPLTERSSAEALAARVTGAMSEPFHLPGHVVTISASVGISLSGQGEMEAAPLLRRADLALYKAKEAGRGRFVYAEPLNA